LKINLTLAQKGFLLVAVPLVFELACVSVLFSVWQESRSQTAREMQDRVIVAEINSIMRLTMSTANLALLNDTLPDRSILVEQRQALNEIKGRFRRLDELVKNHPMQQSVSRASAHLQKLVALTDGFATIAELQNPAKLSFLTSLYKEMHAFHIELTNLLASQEQREQELERSEAAAQQTINIILLTLIISSISLAVGLAFYFNTQAARRLAVVMDSITRLSGGLYGSLPLDGADEFAKLDRDIHAMAAKLLEAARRERAIVENAVDVIFSIDTKGQFTAVNAAGIAMWQYSENEFGNMTVSDLIDVDQRQEVIKLLREAAFNQKPCSIEVTTQAKDGTKIEQLWSVSWSEPEQTLFCVAHDITERNRVEQLKQEFVAMITHDLRSPLTSIKILLSLLSSPESTLTPEWRERVARAEENTTRLIALINDLLDLEKMQAGKLAINQDICLIDEIVKTGINAMQGTAESKKIKISHRGSSLMVLADERRVVQVIVNLLANAIKFSPANSAIDITSLAKENFVEVRVSDTGRGIPADKLESIFTRFEQVSAADSKDKNSTGLGLAICNEIVKAHGGEIGVESREGQGSTFWFRLRSAE
jgi:PAS domain S-box-containing protein